MLNDLLPPGVWVSIHPLEDQRDETREVTIRLRCHGERSITYTREVERYAPEETILLAASRALAQLSAVQRKLVRADLVTVFDQCCTEWVAPF
jgi:hypothetical protein